ncbi:MAG: hypothetical protein K6E91_02460 [Butyrivibrio sp.]|nr:hypothetical protein [Butyrivibrio sp.]
MPAGLDNFGSSLKGMFTDGAGEKAVLYIYLTDAFSIKSKDDFNKEVGELNTLATSLMKETKSRISPGNLWKDAKNTFIPGSSGPDKVGELTSDKKFIKFTVQYNPQTVRLSSVSGKVQAKKADGGIEKLDVYNFAGKSKLSFDLIFDDCDNMNAFMINDVVNTNVSGLVNKGLDAYSHGGLTHSVRKRMDAIMSLLSSRATQQVIFAWGKMIFRGSITDVENRFIMFNPAGNPIRGEMHIELTQDKATADLNYDETYWDKAFKDCFKPATKDSLTGLKGNSYLDRLSNNPFLNI